MFDLFDFIPGLWVVEAEEVIERKGRRNNEEIKSREN